MTNEQVVGLFGTCRDLVALEEKKLETMKKLIFAYAVEHLKQNEVKQSMDDWQFTRAALDMLMGKKQFVPNVGGFFSKQGWPTHLRITDLKPVRIRWERNSTGISDHVMYVRLLRSSKVEYGINQKMLDEQFLPLSDEEIK